MLRSVHTWLALASVVALLAFDACRFAAEETDDSESHFLAFCEGECGGGLSCVCGVCTQTCKANDVCGDLAEGATCVSQLVECGELTTESSAVCEFSCDSDASCASLGGGYQCVRGACRVGSSSVVDGGGGGGAPGKDAGGGEVGEDASAGSGGDGGSNGSAGTGGDAGEDASAGFGGNGGNSSDASDQSCEEVRKAFDEELRQLQACDRDDQCGQVLTGTSCGCTRNLVIRKDADPSELNALREIQVGGESCVELDSPCDCPDADGFVCLTGSCTWNYVQEGCCLIYKLTWNKDGGLLPPNFYRQQYQLSGCHEFGFTQGTASCTNELPDCDGAGISADQVNVAVDATGFPSVVGSVIYGRDTRPVDGVVDVIQIDESYEAIIGEPCNGAAGCEPVPQAVSDLLSLLVRLAAQQNASAGCAPQPGCYEPQVAGPCEAAIVRYSYDPALGCHEFTWGGCDPNGNNFETLEACQAACLTDPCASGLAFSGLPPDDCDAVARSSCFSSTTSACACECAANGAPLDNCSVTDDTPAIASCTP